MPGEVLHIQFRTTSWLGSDKNRKQSPRERKLLNEKGGGSSNLYDEEVNRCLLEKGIKQGLGEGWINDVKREKVLFGKITIRGTTGGIGSKFCLKEL